VLLPNPKSVDEVKVLGPLWIRCILVQSLVETLIYGLDKPGGACDKFWGTRASRWHSWIARGHSLCHRKLDCIVGRWWAVSSRSKCRWESWEKTLLSLVRHVLVGSRQGLGWVQFYSNCYVSAVLTSSSIAYTAIIQFATVIQLIRPRTQVSSREFNSMIAIPMV